MSEQVMSSETIETFLKGRDPQKYIVAIEASPSSNEVSLVINDPVEGKYIEKHKFQPFIWLKHDVALTLYGGNRGKIREAMRRFGVTIKALNTKDKDGNVPDRIESGFKYIAKCTGSYYDLQNFFKQGGLNTYAGSGEVRLFFSLTPAEQFLIQTGKRLFKGMDDYDDLHRLQFDLETAGLNHQKDRIFQIGIRDNRGLEIIIEVESELNNLCLSEGRLPTEDESRIIAKELRDSERLAIEQFFAVVDATKPDVITGYNSENFDWDYFYGRCSRLHVDITKFAKTLNPDVKIFRKNSSVKYGQETEHYEQTYMWGYNIIDIMHAVRKAQAINSDIKKAGLKYITQFSKIAKKNRVYVDGGILFKTWASQEDYYFNDEDGTWFKYDPKNHKHVLDVHADDSKYVKVTGAYIVQRYLLDDLWETEQVDNVFNQATFLISKLLPTPYMRAATMGTAGTWKLIMSAWSYENDLAIPDFEPKREFTGGLSRLIEVGFARNVLKLDFAALYPKIQLTHGIAPSLDISGVMPYLLGYIVDTRDLYKGKTGEEKRIAKALEVELESKRDSLTDDEIKEFETKITHHFRLSSNYDKEQLPLKILANSFFGSFGAPYLFPWGEIDSAEETTCRGRQYLRLMVRHFYEVRGFRPLVGDTDGFNFAAPEGIEDFTYICKANHWTTDMYEVGQELKGLDAIMAEFNELYMIGRMGLDVDDICNSTINFARKNYANDIDGHIKLVGNSIKSKTMPAYIEDFLDVGIRLLLDGKGYEFIEYYYEYINKIYNYEIPLAKIASKKRVKQTIDEYVNVYCKTKTKAGNYKSKQAHMELAIAEGLDVDLGDMIYYVNTGDVKSHGDIKTTTDKVTGEKKIELRCKLVPAEQIENDPNLTTDEYNVPKYLEAFNKRISKLLVCFSPEIRDQIPLNVTKDKKTKEFLLDERPYFTRSQCAMDAGNPFKPEEQDTYEDLMVMEDKEISFWSKIGKVPNNMEESEWLSIEADWKARMKQARIDGIKYDKARIFETFKRLEVEDIEQLKTDGILPKTILIFAELRDNKKHGPSFYSIEWDVWLCKLEDIFMYEEQSIERSLYYKENPDMFKKLKRGQTKYDIWEAEMDKLKVLNGPPSDERFNPSCTERLCGSEEWDGKCPCSDTFGGDKDKLNEHLGLETKLAESDADDEVVNDAVNDAVNNAVNVVMSDVVVEGKHRNHGDKEWKPLDEPLTGTITMDDVNNCVDCDDDDWGF